LRTAATFAGELPQKGKERFPGEMLSANLSGDEEDGATISVVKTQAL